MTLKDLVLTQTRREPSIGSRLADFDCGSVCSSPRSVKIKNTFLHVEDEPDPRGLLSRACGSQNRSNSETLGLCEEMMGRLSPRARVAAPEVLFTDTEGEFVMSVEVDPPKVLPRPRPPRPGSGLYGGVPGSGQQYHNADSMLDECKTTVMLRNIPNKYTRSMLLDRILACGFGGTFDFLYLPIDVRNLCNMGYAFVNFISPKVDKYDCKFLSGSSS
jgi:hypothetical protein